MSHPIPERCYYCESETVDHKHGGGASCGDCCGMHGMLTAPEYKHGEYQWVDNCIKAKNERIATLTAELRVAKQELDALLKSDEKQCSQVYFDLAVELDVQSTANPTGAQGSVFGAVAALKAECATLRATVARLQAPVVADSVEWNKHIGTHPSGAFLASAWEINALIAARAAALNAPKEASDGNSR